MAGSNHLKLNVKFNLILSCVLLILFLGTAFLTYQNQQQLAQKIALDQGRSVTRELITIFNHMSDIVRDEPETNYALVPQVVATQIAKKISADDRYSIRQVSLTYRNPDNQPDAYEAEQLQAFAASKDVESYQVIKSSGEEVFRYMQALVADQSCLKCHGRFESAPGFIQQRFQKGHPSYNYQVGDILGAVSVIKPMTDLYGEVARNLKQALFYRAGILLIVVLITWLFVRQFIICPIQTASKTIHRITSTGSLQERIQITRPRDEIGQLLIDFNAMMSELDRTTLQRQESEDRYRSLIESAESAIVTFLADGKIVISNQQAEHLIGLSRAALLGESFYDFLEDSGRLKAEVVNMSQADKKDDSEVTGSYLFRSTDGSNQEVKITLLLASAVENAPMFTAILRRL